MTVNADEGTDPPSVEVTVAAATFALILQERKRFTVGLVSYAMFPSTVFQLAGGFFPDAIAFAAYVSTFAAVALGVKYVPDATVSNERMTGIARSLDRRMSGLADL